MEELNTTETKKSNYTVIKGDYVKYLTFTVGAENYGIEVSNVKEIIEYGRVFKVPRVSGYIRGLTNLRGEVVPVIDLSYRFYDNISEVTIQSSIVFIEIEHNNKTILMGVMIDKVDAVVDIFHKDMENIPNFCSKIRSDFIRNIGKVNDEFIILLDIDRVLSIEELVKMH